MPQTEKSLTSEYMPCPPGCCELTDDNGELKISYEVICLLAQMIFNRRLHSDMSIPLYLSAVFDARGYKNVRISSIPPAFFNKFLNVLLVQKYVCTLSLEELEAKLIEAAESTGLDILAIRIGQAENKQTEAQNVRSDL